MNKTDLLNADILFALVSALKERKSSIQSIQNHKSIFNQFLKFFNATVTDNAAQFFIHFKQNLAQFLESKGYQRKSISSKKHMLKNFHRMYLKLTVLNDLPKPFNQRLKLLIASSSYSKSFIAKKIGVSTGRINDWCRGRNLPSIKNRDTIFKLEKLLGLNQGTLSDTVTYWHGDGRHNQKRDFPTTFALLQSIRGKVKYAFQYDFWLPALKDQWIGLSNHHTQRIKPILPRNRYAFWSRPSTITKRRYFFESFFGFLILPKEKGGLEFAIEDLDFRLLAVLDEEGRLKLFEQYMHFHLHRTICDKYPVGVYSKSLIRDLKMLACYFNSKYGYFVHAPAFNSVENWKAICSKVMDRIVDLQTGEFEQIRYPNELGHFILLDPRPSRFLKMLVVNLEKELPATVQRPADRRIYNWYFVCAFLSAIPLRASMLCKMKIDQNLYQENGKWRVKFERGDFKNHRGAAKDRDYDVICPDWLEPIIEKYLDLRKTFPGGGTTDGKRDCDFVIRPAVNNGARKDNNLSIATNTLFKYCICATSKYIPNCKGFGPHFFRHIIATDWIKSYPEGHQIAAEILHDKIETVLKHYSHLKTGDWLRVYNNHSEDLFGSPKKTDDPEVDPVV
jgi:integrase